MSKKKGVNDVLSIDFSKKGLKKVVKDFNRTIQRSTGINDHINNIRKVFTRYEEPFCEIRQNHKGMQILVKLPEVKKKDIFLNISQTSIEVKASSIIREDSKNVLKAYYRLISIPSCSLPEKTKADYNNDNLKIKVPYTKIKIGLEQP